MTDSNHQRGTGRPGGKPNKRTLVVYTSHTGFTARYAGWIAEELGADLMTRREARRIGSAGLGVYGTIVYGGSLHASGISGVRFVKDRLTEWADKGVVVFLVGASPPKPETIDSVIHRNFSPSEQAGIRFFYLRGGFDFTKLDFPSKLIMTLFRWKLRMAREKTDEVRGMLAAYDTPADYAVRENIADLVEYLRGSRG